MLLYMIQSQSWFWNHLSSINSRIKFFKSSISLKAKPIFSYLYPIVTLSHTDGSFWACQELSMSHTSGQITLGEQVQKVCINSKFMGPLISIAMGILIDDSEQSKWPAIFPAHLFYSQLQDFPTLQKSIMSSSQKWSKRLIIENNHCLMGLGIIVIISFSTLISTATLLINL